MKTARLGTDPSDIERAAELLRDGKLVAFPTDTVYGLGADATNDRAVAEIFAAKDRPTFNPLIVHVSSIEMAVKLGHFDETARAFVKTYWPEPVSVVVPLVRTSGLSKLVTAGQDSVALRMPRAPVARQLIDAFGGPIAAPSANPSGRISSTTADHVLSGLDGRIAAVIDGGPCPAGVESTIIGFLGGSPRLLREGAFVPDTADLEVNTEVNTAPRAPGQLASHYAPVGAIRLEAETAEEGEFHIGFADIAGDVTLSANGDLIEAAARLYAALHQADARGAERIAVAPIPENGLGRAINDRLRRAAAPRGKANSAQKS